MKPPHVRRVSRDRITGTLAGDLLGLAALIVLFLVALFLLPGTTP
jgi:uncharacterized membrane protein YccC